MATVALHDYTFDQDPGIQLQAGRISIVFVDDEVADVYRRSPQMIMTFVDRMADLLEKDKLSADLLVFNQPLAAQKFIADNQHSLSLIISDNNMPNISGFEMIQGLRDQNVETPAIIRSGLPDCVPRGVVTACKLGSPKVFYQNAVRPLLIEQGHLAADKAAEVLPSITAGDAPLAPTTVYGATVPLATATKT